MEIKPTKKRFYILPLFMVTKYENPLTEAAKKTFDSNWNYYYTVKIGWLFWSIEF